MITSVSLKNFKLHASTKIEAAPITVFIGPNNSGKSSIFQALLSLRQAASI
ncbi:MAG: AAA family ATPase, partial [Acidobacteria bacterium]|nr:AAA family ATPase [Acidobacteriota bacterium]